MQDHRPDWLKVYASGIHARFVGVSLSLNPHEPESDDWFEWQQGWKGMHESLTQGDAWSNYARPTPQ